jgi:hypothetical protein
MRDFWIGMAVAHTAAAGTEAEAKPAHHRYRVLSIVGGIALSLLVGGALLMVLALNVG